MKPASPAAATNPVDETVPQLVRVRRNFACGADTGGSRSAILASSSSTCCSASSPSATPQRYEKCALLGLRCRLGRCSTASLWWAFIILAKDGTNDPLEALSGAMVCPPAPTQRIRLFVRGRDVEEKGKRPSLGAGSWTLKWPEADAEEHGRAVTPSACWRRSSRQSSAVLRTRRRGEPSN